MAKILNKDPFTYQQEKDDFLKALQQFHACRGSPFDRIPRIGGKEVDLYLLYRRVISFGGWRKISSETIWEQILRDFKVPKGCSNGTQALKYIYVRFLDTYEKIHFHGADPKEPDIVEEHEGPLRKKACLPVFGIPQSYNYDQHKVHDLARTTLGLSTDFRKINDYDKLEKALLSGLPNEVDFVINVCTLLSNESRHTLLLDKSPQLVKLLLAHIGIFENNEGSYEKVYESSWRKLSNRDYINFWYQTVGDETANRLIHSSRSYKQRDMLGKEVLNLGKEDGVHDKEGQRIMQLSVIMRNLSFEEENMKFMSSSNLVFRFLMLCVHSSYGSLRQLALDTLGNIAEKYVLIPDDNTYLVLQLLRRFLASDDKYDVVRGLEILSKLCLVDENEAVLTENLADQVYSDIVRLMNVFDIQIIVYSLEALYQMSELGEHTTTKIAAVKHAVDLLVTLLTVEAQAYGPNSLVGIKVVEYCPPSHMVPGGVSDQGQTGAHAPPISQPLPPSHKTAQQQFGGCDVESTTCNWIQSAFEQRDGVSMSHVHLYAEYINFAKKFSLPQILPSQTFLSCVKLVYPSIDHYSTEKPDGLMETGFKGVCKRKNPLPFVIPSTAVNKHRASSVVHSSPAVMSSPNQSSSTTVDLTQTPTLRQRLMEPPKLSALQASPSLLPLGGAEVTKQQQSAIYTSSKPHTQTQTSSALQVQVSQGGGAMKQGTNLIGHCVSPNVLSSNLQSLNGQQNIIHRSQNIIKQKVHSNPPPLQSPSLPQQTGPPLQSGGQNIQTIVLQHQNFQPCDQVAVSLGGVVTNQRSSNDTRMIKTLLANKLRHQSTPVPIAPKVSPSVDTSNPMHLLTFTTQQSTVIQGQLQQQNLSPQAYSGVNSPQQYEQYPTGQVQIQGIQSVMDGSQQYVLANANTGVVNAVNSSQPSPASSHRSRSPKSEKSKAKNKNNASRSGSSRSASPKGSSPKRKSSTSSRSSSPRATSPRNYELEVCGEIERAKDVVQVGLEARIERVENNCLKQIQNMKQNLSVNIPSTSHQMISSVSLPHVSQNIILPIVVGSTHTGHTGNLIAAASDPCHQMTTTIGHNDLSSSTGSVLSAQVNSVHMTSNATSLPEQGQFNIVLPATTQINNEHNSIIPNTVYGNELSLSCSNPEYAESVKVDDNTNCVQSLSPDQDLKMEETVSVEKEKPKLKYVCSQDETEAAVSSLLINEDDTQQSLSNGSETDVPMSSAVVNETEETEAAISAITGLLDDETDDTADDVILNDTEDVNDDMNLEQNGIPMSEDKMSDCPENKDEGIDGNAPELVNHVGLIERSDDLSVIEENGKDRMGDLCSRSQGIMFNGVVVSSNDLDIIPSPTEDKCEIKINGLGDSDTEDFDKRKLEQKETIDKMAAEKLAKMNGIINHIGNGDYKDESMEIEMTLGEGMEEGVVLNADGVSVVIQAGDGDQLIVNSQDTLEMNGNVESMEMEGTICSTEKTNSDINIVPNVNVEINGTESESKCYELAGEPEIDTSAREEEEDEVIIENEMFLQPTASCASVNMETNTVCEQKDDKLDQVNIENDTANGVLKIDCSETQNDLTVAVPDTGCVDILKAAIESEKIDEIVLNGDSNDSMPVVTQDGIYQSDIQFSVSSENIPIGNEMTTTVPSSGINFIPNVFSNVQPGLVVGAIVSLNNNILTTANVPLSTCITDNINSKAKVSLEVCPNRHVPTPETSRDSELSCDSIASSLTDSSIDKHSISIQQPFINVQPNIQTTNILSVQTVPAKSPQIITSVVTTASNQTSPRSRSGEKRPKKRNRNASGSADSRCSSSSSTSKPPYTAVQQSLPQFMCEWAGCKQCFENVKSVFFHVNQTHLRFDKEGYCQWEGCEKLQRKKWSLVTHVQDHHCSEIALKTSIMRRQSGGGSQSQTVPALVYPPDAAWQAIRRFSPKAPYPEFTEPREGPVTKHIRLTAALVLRNLARYSSLGRSLIKKHERHISFTAMSALESSNALANCLFEILHDH